MHNPLFRVQGSPRISARRNIRICKSLPFLVPLLQDCKIQPLVLEIQDIYLSLYIYLTVSVLALGQVHNHHNAPGIAKYKKARHNSDCGTLYHYPVVIYGWESRTLRKAE